MFHSSHYQVPGKLRAYCGFFCQALFRCQWIFRELLGLMTLHLLLLSLTLACPHSSRSILIYSDCTGAWKPVSDLQILNIPSRCKQADILRIIKDQTLFNAFTATHLGSSRWQQRMVLACAPCSVELQLQHGSQALYSGVIPTGPHTWTHFPARTSHADSRLRKKVHWTQDCTFNLWHTNKRCGNSSRNRKFYRTQNSMK